MESLKQYLQERINKKNRKRLKNTTPSLICNNCLGGFIYHWLGLKFNSPFINLYLEDNDFLLALENLKDFLACDIKEVKNSYKDYPVGCGYRGIKIHFMHYASFDEAYAKWNERKLRVDYNNIRVIMSNKDGYDDGVIERFDSLKYEKVIFVDKVYPQFKSAYYIKGLDRIRGKKNIYSTQYINGKRYVDQFDYVKFINGTCK